MAESETKGNAAEQKRLDRISRSVLFQGASISQLGLLFGQDNRTVSKKLQGCDPVGKRAGFPVYAIKDAAPYLVTPVGDFETYLKGMNHRDLPPALTKEFWQGQKLKQQFEEERGDLWRTDDVIDKFAQTFQTLRMSLLLMSDSVERETAFSERQREILKALVDSTLEDIRVSLIEGFAGDEDEEFEPDAEGNAGEFEPDDEDEAFWDVGPSNQADETGL